MMTDEGCERATQWAELWMGLGLDVGAAGFLSAMRTRPIVSTLMTQMTLTHGPILQKSSTHPVNQSPWILTPGKGRVLI